MSTDTSKDEASSLHCSAENVVDSDFCPTDEKDTKNTIIKGQNEETSTEVTANRESGGKKIANNTSLTLDEKTNSEKQGKDKEFASKSRSFIDASKIENEPMSTNIHRQLEGEIRSHPQHVSTPKKENENNSESDSHAMQNLDKSNSDAISRQVKFNGCLLIDCPPFRVKFPSLICDINTPSLKLINVFIKPHKITKFYF